jgi:hypothetical protein
VIRDVQRWSKKYKDVGSDEMTFNLRVMHLMNAYVCEYLGLYLPEYQ